MRQPQVSGKVNVRAGDKEVRISEAVVRQNSTEMDLVRDPGTQQGGIFP
jgi:hypothetical protein